MIKKKKISEETTSDNGHYMVSMTGRRPKICGNRLLTSPYLQR